MLRFLAIALAAFLLAGCREYPERTNVIGLGADAPVDQLLWGVYPPEGKSDWRWVGRSFSVSLQPPHVGPKGGYLKVQLYLPDNEISKIGTLTLTAGVNEQIVGSETYSSAGSYTFTKNLSAEMLDTNLLNVVFVFNNAMPPTPEDGRELAAVVSEVAVFARR